MKKSTTFQDHRNGGSGRHHHGRFSPPQPPFRHHNHHHNNSSDHHHNNCSNHNNNNNNRNYNNNNNNNNKNENRPQFKIHLRNTEATATTSTADHNNYENVINSIISECGAPSPDGINFFRSGTTVSLSFRQRPDAMSFMTSFWTHRLRGSHSFSPELQRAGLLPSDVDDLNMKLKALFLDHVRAMIEGGREPLMSWQLKLQGKVEEIEEVKRSLKAKNNSLRVYGELTDRNGELGGERDLIEKRIREFKDAMAFVLEYLEVGVVEGEEDRVKLFAFDREADWEKLYCFILRETRRLDDGLPIYTYRQDILRMIAQEQVRSFNCCAVLIVLLPSRIILWGFRFWLNLE